MIDSSIRIHASILGLLCSAACVGSTATPVAAGRECRIAVEPRKMDLHYVAIRRYEQFVICNAPCFEDAIHGLIEMQQNLNEALTVAWILSQHYGPCYAHLPAADMDEINHLLAVHSLFRGSPDAIEFLLVLRGSAKYGAAATRALSAMDCGGAIAGASSCTPRAIAQGLTGALSALGQSPLDQQMAHRQTAAQREIATITRAELDAGTREQYLLILRPIATGADIAEMDLAIPSAARSH